MENLGYKEGSANPKRGKAIRRNSKISGEDVPLFSVSPKYKLNATKLKIRISDDPEAMAENQYQPDGFEYMKCGTSPPAENVPISKYDKFEESFADLSVQVCQESIRNSLVDQMKVQSGHLQLLEHIEGGQITSSNVSDVFEHASKYETNISFLWSCFVKRWDLLENLHSVGAEHDFIDANGISALHLAAFAGCTQSTNFLIAQKIDINLQPKTYTPLHFAAFGNSTEVAKILIDNGASIFISTNKQYLNESLLHCAVRANAIECIQLFIQEGADVNSIKPNGTNPIHLAADLGLSESLKALLDTPSADPNIRICIREKESTALHLAADEGNVDCINLLLAKGADAKLKNHRGFTALHLAARTSSLECVESLLCNGNANPNAEDFDKRTPLHAAIGKTYNSLQIIETLVMWGTNINHKDIFGFTAVHLAALEGLSQCVDMLIYYGADVTTKSRKGTSALNVVARKIPESLTMIKHNLDNAITLHESEDPLNRDVELELDFRQLSQHCHPKEISYLHSFIEEGQKEFLEHPLCIAFLYIKWKKMRKFFIVRLVFCFITVAFLSLYVLTALAHSCYNGSRDLNETIKDQELCQKQSIFGDLLRNNPFVIEMQWWVLVVIILFEIVRKLYGLTGYSSIKHYVTQIENIIEWFVIVSVFLTSYIYNKRIDCLHLQLYRDSKDRYKQGQTKASLSLQHFLGVESGFTLDKESNTIAIICQDVIVVLAFDTRERLIQWQVKISHNLGDDIQYLVLVSTAPSKAKLSTGPARMHVQDNRFCLTTGVPPKLAGLWDIGYLRRYGVVEGRFCFEGGSRCGKGEGLYIFVTDQGEEITHTLKLASQGKLATKRRAVARKLSAMDSPRKQISPRPPDIIPEDGCLGHIENSSHACICSINRTSYWPSQESRDLDSNYGCGDTVSVSEGNDSFNDADHFPRNSMSNMERCMSCISKLGAPSMSRSSTATGAGTPASGQPPNWSLISEQNFPNHSNHCSTNQVHLGIKIQGLDRMSVCSSHGSFGSSSSEYSVPRQTTNSNKSHESWYEHIPSSQRCQNHRASSPCQCCPPRPPKPKVAKPAMPLPITKPLNSSTPNPTHVGPYENYDVPKTPVQIENSTVTENYDTPKKIQEYLIKDMNSNSSTIDSNKYANYDVPANIGNMCGCLVTANEKQISDNGPRVDCTCNRVMSWADNWISLPYCRRGNGIENTGVPINKVKLSGEGKMPVVQPSGELAIYATVDMTKKINRRLLEECECPHDDDDEEANQKTANYMNVDADKQLLIVEESKSDDREALDANYTNLEFALSLENYENAKEVLKKAGFSVGELEETLLQCMPRTKLCNKCGHASRRKPGKNDEKDESADQLSQVITNDKPEDYMLMEPNQKHRRNFPGYLPMSPATPLGAQSAPPLPSKELMKRIIGEKSASNPTLSGPVVDRSRKRSEQEARVPGSAMMLLHKSGGSPYTRKLLMDNSDLLPTDKRLNGRKRSSSADSSRFLEDPDEFESSETLRKSSLSQIEGRRSSSPCIHQETEQCPDNNCCTKLEPSTETEDDTSLSTTNQSQNSQSQSVYIRRSASVPCKTQNRDSSSSNDSGVSTGSMRHRTGEFTEFELPLTTSMSARRHQRNIQPLVTCVHASLPRRSKSFDPLREITFQFQRIKIPEKSTSAEAEIPICPPKSKGYSSPNEQASMNGQPYIDSRSTSSGTSDMSDYIETLSLSSHSSSDAPEGMRLVRQATSTLRPRSGKEYQNIDRSIISLTQSSDGRSHSSTPSQLRGLLSCSANYANITPVPENVESPSPGYQSGGSPQDPQTESFMFKN